MKKLLSVFIISIMIISSAVLCVNAADEGLPFHLVAPGYVSAVLVGGDSPTTTNLAFSLSNEMTTFFKNKEKAHLNETIE
jgi:hypothetical protein